MVDRRNMPVEDLIRSQFQSEEEVTDHRSSHFKLCIAVNFKSLSGFANVGPIFYKVHSLRSEQVFN